MANINTDKNCDGAPWKSYVLRGIISKPYISIGSDINLFEIFSERFHACDKTGQV